VQNWCVAASKKKARFETLFYDPVLLILWERNVVDNHHLALRLVGAECGLRRDPLLHYREPESQAEQDLGRYPRLIG